MITPDGREIVFAGAGILWGATAFFQGLRVWRAASAAERKSSRKAIPPLSLVTGFALMTGCSAYLAWLTQAK